MRENVIGRVFAKSKHSDARRVCGYEGGKGLPVRMDVRMQVVNRLKTDEVDYSSGHVISYHVV